MKKILVPVDFSAASRNASEYAIAFVKIFKAEIVLLHALFIPSPLEDFPGYSPLSSDEMVQESEYLLRQEIEWLGKTADVSIDGFVRTGSLIEMINHMVDEIKPDFIVMGTNGVGKADGIFGSTVTSCIRIIKLPLLVIPENITFSPVKSICFAADFGKWPSLKSYKLLSQLLLQFKSPLNIVHVAQKEDKMSTEMISGKIRADLLFENVEHRFHTVLNDDVEEGLHEFMTVNKTDLLVMVAHEHNIFKRLFGTVHTKQMTYKSGIPLLILHD